MNGFCSWGFIPPPSAGVTARRTKGRVRKLTRTRKKIATTASVVTTTGMSARFLRRFRRTMAAAYERRMNSQNRIEPDWPAQSAANLYSLGRARFEYEATYSRSKRSVKMQYSRLTTASATSPQAARTARSALRISWPDRTRQPL